MSTLTKLYDEKGELRVYRDDEEGNGHLYYEDTNTEIVIRESFKENDTKKIRSIAKIILGPLIKKRITKKDANNFWIFESKSGRLIAIGLVQITDISERIIKLYFKNENLRSLDEKNVKKALYNICKKSRIFDKLYIMTFSDVELIYDLEKDEQAQ